MLMFSIRARMTNLGIEAPTWAHQMAELVSKKTGITTRVATRIGGAQEIVWVTNYDDFAAFEKAQAIQSDPDYLAKLKEAADAGLFQTATVESALWREI
jgi:hypothetical protein